MTTQQAQAIHVQGLEKSYSLDKPANGSAWA
jgi:hypothetical protein